MSKDKDEIQEETDFAKIAVIDGKKSSLDISIAILCASILFTLYLTGQRIVNKITDKSVISVKCPTNVNQNKPTLLTNSENESLLQTDNRLKQFIQDYLFSLYPRFEEDIESHYRYVVSHTKEGSYIYDDYYQRLENLNHFIGEMTLGKYTVLYFDKKEFKIRKPQAKNRVQEELFKNRLEILVDGYMHMHNGVRSKIHNPTILLTIEFVPSTKENPEGIEVIDFKGLQLRDPITGKLELI